MQERAFDRREDVIRLQAFVSELRTEGILVGTLQFGDLMYEMFHPLTGFEPKADIRIWEGDDGRLCGFVFYRPPDNPEFFMRADLYGHSIEGEMIQWALDRAVERGVTSVETSCLDRDTAKAALLCRHGFTKTDDVCVLLERSLSEPLPDGEPPDGYSIVTLAERPEYACGIPDSGLEHQLYKQIQSAPGYRADLDVRAVYRDTLIVSGCTCWYDEVGQCGQFQPVGTQEEHRRKGLAAATMIRAMENLRRHGAARVFVWTARDLNPAVRLYESLGFRIKHEDSAWERAV
jgi:GNAT superfamily N-acetyltransferase